MKKAIKSILATAMYWLYKSKLLKNPLKVMSIDETLDELLATEKSLMRFGDGEVALIKGADLHFQKHDPQLAAKMKQLLHYDYDNLLVTIPDIFDGLEQYQARSKAFWREHLLFCRKYYYRYCDRNKVYGQTGVSRAYDQFADKSPCAGWFAKIRKIWDNKKVVVVEGTVTHNGVGNDLLDTAATVERIICPAQNAAEVYAEILAACREYPKDRLFLVSLGPTAKLLAEDLYNDGYRVLDIGQLDMEYEWFLRKATEKIPLAKHRIVGEEANQKAGYAKYWAEIKRVVPHVQTA
ncbi:MAG: GT-D fold domain-containing protein [Lachnospiraceae bacterium]|jgi:glycosyltransferase family protein|nr:GT-D fold domain-containing protein [Lachnospiraceae bacterium]